MMAFARAARRAAPAPARAARRGLAQTPALEAAKRVAASFRSGAGAEVEPETGRDVLRSSSQAGLPRLDSESERLASVSTADPLFSRVKTNAAAALAAYPAAEVTTLSNGVRVATERVAGQTATVAVNVDTGSRYETEQNNGVAHFLEHLIFKGTPKRSQAQLESETEAMGYQLNAYTSREATTFLASVDKQGVRWGLDVLSDILQNCQLDARAVEYERGTIAREMEEVDGMLEEVIFDRLHETAYRETALGRTILGPLENIHGLTAADIRQFIDAHYFAGAMVVSVVGDVDHAEVVKAAEEAFGQVPTAPRSGKAPSKEAAVFTGSDIRVRYDSMEEAHVAFAFPTEGFNSAENPTLQVMQTMLGSWDGSPAGVHSGSPLVSYVAQRNSAKSLQPFHTLYSDTGLFGVYAVAEPKALQELMGTITAEIAALAHNPTERLVEEARNQLIYNTVATTLDNNGIIAEELGRQVLQHGRRIHPLEAVERIAQVSVADVRNVARNRFYDRDFALAAIGPVYELPDYNWLRRRTYFQRY